MTNHGKCYYCGKKIKLEQMVCDECCKEYDLGC